MICRRFADLRRKPLEKMRRYLTVGKPAVAKPTTPSGQIYSCRREAIRQTIIEFHRANTVRSRRILRRVTLGSDNAFRWIRSDDDRFCAHLVYCVERHRVW